MTRHTQIPDTYELFLDFLKTSINNQNKICLSDSQIVYTQIVKAIISIWNQLIVAQFKLDASKLNSSLTELGPAQPQPQFYKEKCLKIQRKLTLGNF